MDCKTVRPNQIRDFKGQHLVVLGKYGTGDFWLVCRLSSVSEPRCKEEYQTQKENCVAQYTLAATMSDRWLRFNSNVVDQMSAGDVYNCKRLFECNQKEWPLPADLSERIGPEWNWRAAKNFFVFLEQVVQAEYKEFLSILEPIDTGP